MTFTSDERREVAARLRQASHTDANLDVSIAIAILDTIGEVHRPIAAVVADLIDPTCEVEHQPTVEDVLREFTDEVWNRCCEGATASDSGIDGLVAEYAAKLRLAGEDE